MHPEPTRVHAVLRYIADNWHRTIVEPVAEDEKHLALPHRHVVPSPGRMFHKMYYWDTYYTNLGLYRQGHADLARGNLDNFVHVLDKVRCIPNATSKGMQRSQPPHFCLMVADEVARGGCDRERIALLYERLDWDYTFWQALRQTPCGLNRYWHHDTAQGVWSFFWAVGKRLPNTIPEEPIARWKANEHNLAEAESGWDFCPRFDRRCGDFCPVDLNALLFLHEEIAADLATRLGDAPAAARWRDRAARRAQLMHELLWDVELGAFLDYDWANGRRSRVLSCASFLPLWAGIATPAQAARTAALLPRLERAHGLCSCEPGLPRPERYQWDHPNAWAPLHWQVVQGLKRYGFHQDAQRIAGKYVAAATGIWEQTGKLWEKHNAESGGTDVVDEYAMPELLGWSAGVYIALADELGLLPAGSGAVRPGG
jgi:alpha,alpha-trehalase